MYITYQKYRFLGYDRVPEEEFGKYCAEACAAVDFFTSGKISGDSLDDKNSRGLCEIIDLIKTRRDEYKGNLTAFSNEGYSESYRYVGTAELYAEIYSVMTVRFDKTLLSRGV